MSDVSTKPYLIRAIVEWCVDAGFTPYVAVAVDDSVRVPPEFVKNGEIVLNISTLATHRLQISNDAVQFQARFSGVARDVYVPITRVIAVYARENGQGMAFEVPRALHARDPADDGAADSHRLRAVEGPKPAGPTLALARLPVEPATNADPVHEQAGAASSDGAPPPPPPANGDRPRLTRIK